MYKLLRNASLQISQPFTMRYYYTLLNLANHRGSRLEFIKTSLDKAFRAVCNVIIPVERRAGQNLFAMCVLL